jgi:hypothetical protein
MAAKILLIATSSPAKVMQAVDTLKNQLFVDARADLLCTLADLAGYEGNTAFEQILVFPPRRDLYAIQQLRRRIFREGYQAIAVLWCKEPTRMRPKWFALTCSLNHLLVFNENLDCAYLDPRYCLQLLHARIGRGAPPAGLGRVLTGQLKVCARGLLFPLRVAVLFLSASALYAGRFIREQLNVEKK